LLGGIGNTANANTEYTRANARRHVPIPTVS